jgi:hypothetical protein
MSAHEAAQSDPSSFSGVVRPDLPIGSPERDAFFAEARKMFAEDWKEAELSVLAESLAALGDLYFVRAGDAVKIGRTNNIMARLRNIQAHNHEQINCLLLVKGAGATEKALHRKFAAKRLRGEWFAWCPEIEDEIERLRGER